MTWLYLWLQCNGGGKNLHLIIAMIIILLHAVDTLQVMLKRNHTLNAQVSAMLLAWIFRLCDNGLGVLSRIQLVGQRWTMVRSFFWGLQWLPWNSKDSFKFLHPWNSETGPAENWKIPLKETSWGLRPACITAKIGPYFTQKIPMVHLRPATLTRVGWPRFEKSVQKWYRMPSKMVPKSAPTLQESDSPRIRVKQATCKHVLDLLLKTILFFATSFFDLGGAGVVARTRLVAPCTWRVIPVSQWWVTPIFTSHEWPFGRDPILRWRNLTVVVNHVQLTGMILQVGSVPFPASQIAGTPRRGSMSSSLRNIPQEHLDPVVDRYSHQCQDKRPWRGAKRIYQYIIPLKGERGGTACCFFCQFKAYPIPCGDASFSYRFP